MRVYADDRLLCAERLFFSLDRLREVGRIEGLNASRGSGRWCRVWQVVAGAGSRRRFIENG